MAMRIASKAPQRFSTVFNGYQKSFSRQLSCSPRFLVEVRTVGTRTRFDKNDSLIRHHTSSDEPEYKKKTLAQPSSETSGVNLVVNDKLHRFSSILLRDLCQCNQCVDPSTRQKLFATVDIPWRIRPKHTEWHAGNVHITWISDIPGADENHSTVIPMHLLERIVDDGKPVRPRQTLPRSLWDSQTYERETRDFEYESYMNDESVLFTALQQLETHGLLFVTNVPESEQSVETVAERIGPLKTTFYGRTWDVRSVPEAKNVAYTSQNLGFHMDLMYMKQPPHLQLLHCIRSSAAGGASLFSDSFKAAQELADTDPKHFKALSRIPVTYHYDHPDHYYNQSRPVIEHAPIQIGPNKIKDFPDYMFYKSKRYNKTEVPDYTPMDFIEHVAWSPPFQGPFSLHSDHTKVYGAPEGFLNHTVRGWHAAATKFNDLIHRPEAIYERMMKPGECVIFDNRRVLHARKAFEVGDAGKERWLRGAYIDKDPYMSKLKVMTEERRRVEQDSDYWQSASEEESSAAVA